jgi:hypothetical protein
MSENIDILNKKIEKIMSVIEELENNLKYLSENPFSDSTSIKLRKKVLSEAIDLKYKELNFLLKRKDTLENKGSYSVNDSIYIEDFLKEFIDKDSIKNFENKANKAFKDISNLIKDTLTEGTKKAESFFEDKECPLSENYETKVNNDLNDSLKKVILLNLEKERLSEINKINKKYQSLKEQSLKDIDNGDINIKIF